MTESTPPRPEPADRTAGPGRGPWVLVAVLTAALLAASTWAVVATVSGGSEDVEDPRANLAAACAHLRAVDDRVEDLPEEESPAMTDTMHLATATVLGELAAERDASLRADADAIAEPRRYLSASSALDPEFRASLERAVAGCD